MKIYGIQKLTLLDYPEKVACTLFTGGCNFRCPFCHNSDLVLKKEVTPYNEDEIFEFLKKRIGILDGVCISGGEPLLSDGLTEFIQKIHSLGYAVKLDTNGSRPKLLKNLLSSRLVDYVAVDVKNSLDKYSETVGISDFDISPILESISLLINGNTDYEFRTTVSAELHSDISIKGIAEMISGAKRCFLQNYKASDKVLMPGLTPVSEEKLNSWCEILKSYVNFVKIRV